MTYQLGELRQEVEGTVWMSIDEPASAEMVDYVFAVAVDIRYVDRLRDQRICAFPSEAWKTIPRLVREI